MGAAYGLSCVGCCWALMALGVLAGAAGLVTMAVLTLVMVGERLARRGLRLVRPVGVLLLALAVLVGTGALPPPRSSDRTAPGGTMALRRYSIVALQMPIVYTIDGDHDRDG